MQLTEGERRGGDAGAQAAAAEKRGEETQRDAEEDCEELACAVPDSVKKASETDDSVNEYGKRRKEEEDCDRASSDMYVWTNTEQTKRARLDADAAAVGSGGRKVP